MVNGNGFDDWAELGIAKTRLYAERMKQYQNTPSANDSGLTGRKLSGIIVFLVIIGLPTIWLTSLLLLTKIVMTSVTCLIVCIYYFWREYKIKKQKALSKKLLAEYHQASTIERIAD